jgi:hypothetical protein
VVTEHQTIGPTAPITVEGSIFAAGSTVTEVGVYADTRAVGRGVRAPFHAVVTMEANQIAVQPALLPGSVAAMLKPS